MSCHVTLISQFLTRPSAANQSFPYHVRTTQVGADLSASTEPLDRFDAHSYAPSVTDPSGRIIDVFTVRGVLQVFSAKIHSSHPEIKTAAKIVGFQFKFQFFFYLKRLEPLDVFAATGEAAAAVPAAFKAPPPKYADVFPHETPGQVAEMLKEEEMVSESDENSSAESPVPQGPSRESLYTYTVS